MPKGTPAVSAASKACAARGASRMRMRASTRPRCSRGSVELSPTRCPSRRKNCRRTAPRSTFSVPSSPEASTNAGINSDSP
ncbi:hypothetical protein ACN28S_25490 [Cystobacter fuscus]